MATAVNPVPTLVLAQYTQPAVETHMQLPTSTIADNQQYLALSVMKVVVNLTLERSDMLYYTQPAVETHKVVPYIDSGR